jgi:hypothetical protein
MVDKREEEEPEGEAEGRVDEREEGEPEGVCESS